MRKERGITLIALIITIIIMLILAGVVINLTIGKNGLFKTAKQAAKNYTNAEAKELADLNNINNIIDQAVNGETGGTVPSIPETPTIDETVLALKAGDYIKYNSGTNGEILCRVLYPTSSEYGLQIISDRNVKNVTLGSTTYSKAVESYNNAIETLNDEAEAYINTEYAYDARCVGSLPTVENGIFTKKDNGATTYIKTAFYDNNTNYYKQYKDGLDLDTNYETDLAPIIALGLNVSSDGKYWLASRYNSPSPSGVSNWIRCGNDPSKVNRISLASFTIVGIIYGYEEEAGLRPCISLKSDIIKITGGDGKSADTAYVIGK